MRSGESLNNTEQTGQEVPAYEKINFLQARGLSTFTPDYASVESTLRSNNLIGPTESYGDFLYKNKMISKDETPEHMFQRVARTLADGGCVYYGKDKVNEYYSIFYELIGSYKLILSTPIYTNAGRHQNKPLSACAVPPVNFRKFNFGELKELIASYHTKGMGTGFNLDETEDPVEILDMLNTIAVAEVKEDLIERPVGNMAILSVNHKKVLDFAAVKLNSKTPEWKFNISVNLTATFMEALQANIPYIVDSELTINPVDFLTNLAECARQTGDPGVVFMHRYETSNKVPHLGSYKSLAPCGEVPLLNGEVCQFGYLNLSHFVQNGDINYDEMRSTIHYAITMLDNAIEISLRQMPTEESYNIVSKIRKVGLGVCGFSDLLMSLGLPYHSDEAIKLAESLISFINYESKLASINLAKVRNPFPELRDSRTLKELIIGPYINYTTDTVTASQWKNLNYEFLHHGIRNVATVILPPTGRSSLVGGVSASIEPPFKLVCDTKTLNILREHCNQANYQGDFNKVCAIIKQTGSILETDLPDKIKEIFLTCLELPYQAHLRIVAAFQKFTDEAISKTVNLPENSTCGDVVSIYRQAYDAGLKGITVYVDKSRMFQPKSLMSHSSDEAVIAKNEAKLSNSS